MLNVEMQTYTYIGSTMVQIYYTILADIVRHKNLLFNHACWKFNKSAVATSLILTGLLQLNEIDKFVVTC